MRFERRRYDRYLSRKNAFAALGSKYNRIGKIIDISLSGLSFQYILGENSCSNSLHVDIFLVGNLYHLYNVPCEMIYDIQIHVPHVNSRLIKMLTIKRCGVQFRELSDYDLTQLKLFIEGYTIKLA